MLFPIVVVTDSLPENVNARNWPFFVKIRPRLKRGRAVLCQEVFESNYMASCGRFLLWAVIIVAHKFFKRFRFKKLEAKVWRKLRPLLIDLELSGHEREVQYGATYYRNEGESYRDAVSRIRKEEANALTLYPQFEGLTQGIIELALSTYEEEARSYVATYEEPLIIFGKKHL